jgi:hypothetical protein
MGSIRKPQPVKLTIGFIFKDGPILLKAEIILKKKFGDLDFESETLPFTYTDYYEEELGKGLQRKFISFKKLILPESLPKIKVLTNNIEKKLSVDAHLSIQDWKVRTYCAHLSIQDWKVRTYCARRLINIDPGYVDLSKLVLASTKDFSHRIYMGRGIYSEVTLMYQDKTFNSKEWTYPDYRTPEYIAIFNRIREIFAAQVK